MAHMLKPVYLKNSELPSENDERITNFELVQAVSLCVEDAVKCIQLDRDLWRIYLNNAPSRSKILLEGFDFKNQHITPYDSNPYSAGLESPKDQAIKVTICGVPLSVDDTAIYEMLSKLGVSQKSDLKYEKIRNPTNKKMTNVSNGNRFIYIDPPSRGPLPRFSYCAGLKCKIFHRGQDFEKPTLTCTNCWEAGHLSRNCTNEPKCAACKNSGHEPGAQCCPQYVSGNPKNVEVFNGDKSILSNFYPCQINVFGESFSSAEQAYQLTKAIRTGNLSAAEKIREAKTALDCKMIGKTVSESPQWRLEAKSVMEEIIDAKVSQLSEMKKLLSSSKPSVIFAHSVYDRYWGSGLDADKTLHTNPDAWPGRNVLGKIIKQCAEKCRARPRAWSQPRHQRKTRQNEID